jgi:Leucine-rich repeat (LRR) protein
VDLSHNELSGDVDVLLAPALQSLNLSGNHFTSLIFFKFRASQNTFEKLALTKNDIRQDVSRILENTPPSLKELVLSENHVHGHLPNPLPVLVDLERFIIKGNHITGQIPDLSQSFPNLEELDLSNQTRTNTGGLSGPIPDLPDLVVLDLSSNKLTGAIPPGIGNLPRLKKFVVSNNMLSGGIPKTLRKLAGTCEVLDMSNNLLVTIPPELGDFRDSLDTVVNLRGNANL